MACPFFTGLRYPNDPNGGKFVKSVTKNVNALAPKNGLFDYGSSYPPGEYTCPLVK